MSKATKLRKKSLSATSTKAKEPKTLPLQHQDSNDNQSYDNIYLGVMERKLKANDPTIKDIEYTTLSNGKKGIRINYDIFK